MPKLGINIDHVATLRQARGTRYPDPISAAVIAEGAGADQITVHLREDRRHMQDADIWMLKKTVNTLLNLEMAASDEIVGIACSVRPDVCTFVPERRQELTTEGGLDAVKSSAKLKSYINRLKEKSIAVSLFIDPDISQVEVSRELGVDAVELHTGRYAELCDSKADGDKVGAELGKLQRAAARAGQIGLRVAAGHGLNYDNISLIVKESPHVEEYNIGHAVIARAVFVGLAQAVAEMKKIIRSS